jgi:hypothetical protein
VARGTKVDPSSITDIKRSAKAKPDPEYVQYQSYFKGAQGGDAFEFVPEGEETVRAVMMKVARAAHSLGLKVRNSETERGTVLTEVLEGAWTAKPKPASNGAEPRRRGRPPRASRE